ncbi:MULTISPECIES: TerD family protein [unclassified Gordonia (in: high G+C Gram-positive bacteria)]|uniref:TerD family protein n=1 Tax=unclassified Gordonia (in: high G+C Gram-positive bacteria) TaxID=2657482 RepID=UPI001F0EB940|nr:TerD family protein [Gordonia sp. ABSL49_1]MCH5641269.1 TerD family protein [Gordonia sp. ABSL49_1]
MTALSKGQNAPLPTADLTITVDVGAAADLSALLVTDRGLVRSDADFVFYNQPVGPGVRLETASGRPRLVIATGAIPADIDAVRAVVTLDDPSSNFGRSAPPVARVGDASGREHYDFVIGGLTTESVVITVELYRRGSDWKVRAVGQGYAGGFADLVRDHGVSVDDQPAAPTPPPAPPAYTPPQPPPPAPEINLTKSRPVNLSKGQKVTLRKDGGVALTAIRMGLGWDPVPPPGGLRKRGSAIDLDASVLMFSAGRCVDTVYYGRLNSKDKSIHHSGDNLTGEGEGDDEVISVSLPAVAPSVDNLVFIVTSYRGQTFEEVQNAYCRLIDDTNNAELARFTLAGGMPFTGVVMAVINREGPQWKLRAIGDGFQARTPKKAEKLVDRYLA